MTKLKPQLIVTGSNKKKSGLGGTIGYLLTLVLVFAVGVYVGMQVNGTDFSSVNLAEMSLDRDPEADTVSDSKSVEETTKDSKSESEIHIVSSNTDTKENKITNSDTGFSDKSLIQQNNDSREIQQPSDAENPLSNVAKVDLLNNSSDTQTSAATNTDNTEQDIYRLQVAAFEDIYDANDVVSKLKDKGYNAYVVQSTNSRGERWNLIKVGNFQTAQEAWNFSAVYQNKEGGEVIVESLQKGRVYNESLEENLPE